MALHKALFNDLPDAGKIRQDNQAFLADVKNADGFFIIVQDIAEKYGVWAYELAEEVFRECGMAYDPSALRIPGLVRKVGYVFEGANVYDVIIKEYAPEMAEDVAWLYNREIRKLSRSMLLDGQAFDNILSNGDCSGKAFVAYNPIGQRVGFIHCCAKGGIGSVEAMSFLPGRIHLPGARMLAEAAKKYFVSEHISSISIMGGFAGYPHYRGAAADVVALYKDMLPHIHAMLQEIAKQG